MSKKRSDIDLNEIVEAIDRTAQEVDDFLAATNPLPASPVAKSATGEGQAIDGNFAGQWRVGAWQGREMLTCTRCTWDTVEGIERAREQAAECGRCMPIAPEIRPSLIAIADKRGKVTSEPIEGSDISMDIQEV